MKSITLNSWSDIEQITRYKLDVISPNGSRISYITFMGYTLSFINQLIEKETWSYILNTLRDEHSFN